MIALEKHSSFPNHLSRKLRIRHDFFYEGLKWRCYNSRFSSDGIFFGFVPQIGILLGLTWKSPIIHHFQTHSPLMLPAWIFRQRFRRYVFVNIGFPCKIRLLNNRPIFHSPHWRKISECDCASCFVSTRKRSFLNQETNCSHASFFANRFQIVLVQKFPRPLKNKRFFYKLMARCRITQRVRSFLSTKGSSLQIF